MSDDYGPFNLARDISVLGLTFYPLDIPVRQLFRLKLNDASNRPDYIMKFKYYITDMLDGMIKGTDDRDLAVDLAMSEDYFVLDAEVGVWIMPDGSSKEIRDYSSPEN